MLVTRPAWMVNDSGGAALVLSKWEQEISTRHVERIRPSREECSIARDGAVDHQLSVAHEQPIRGTSFVARVAADDAVQLRCAEHGRNPLIPDSHLLARRTRRCHPLSEIHLRYLLARLGSGFIEPRLQVSITLRC